MALKIVWTSKALTDLHHIQSYLLEAWGEQSVRRFLKKLFQTVDNCAQFPEIGEKESDNSDVRALVVVKQIILFYRVKEHSVVVAKLFDTRQNPDEISFRE